jgi:hypothetical protein
MKPTPSSTYTQLKCTYMTSAFIDREFLIAASQLCSNIDSRFHTCSALRVAYLLEAKWAILSSERSKREYLVLQ